MKKVIIVSLSLCMMGLSSFMVKANDSIRPDDSFVAMVTAQDYCPEGYICEATNCTAKAYGSPSSYKSTKELTGISVYINDKGEVIAYVPGHGHLKCYWGTSGETGWHFDANGGIYVIQDYKRK